MPIEKKNALAALCIGAGVEAAFCLILFTPGGLGPCGPNTLASVFALLVHMPGLFVLEKVGLPDSTGTVLLVSGYGLAWSGIAYRLLGWWSRQGARK